MNNPLWGEPRIANELLVKLEVSVSPRTVSKYRPKQWPGCPRGDHRWATFLPNHAKAIAVCDCFVAVTAIFRSLFVLVLIEHGSRRLLHFNVTKYPTADWTLQPLREVIASRFGLFGADDVSLQLLFRSVRVTVNVPRYGMIR